MVNENLRKDVTTGVNDRGDKFAAGVVDSGGKIDTSVIDPDGVVDSGGKIDTSVIDPDGVSCTLYRNISATF